MTKKTNASKLKEADYVTYYSQKRIIKAAKFPSQNFDGLARI